MAYVLITTTTVVSLAPADHRSKIARRALPLQHFDTGETWITTTTSRPLAESINASQALIRPPIGPSVTLLQLLQSVDPGHIRVCHGSQEGCRTSTRLGARCDRQHPIMPHLLSSSRNFLCDPARQAFSSTSSARVAGREKDLESGNTTICILPRRLASFSKTLCSIEGTSASHSASIVPPSGACQISHGAGVMCVRGDSDVLLLCCCAPARAPARQQTTYDCARQPSPCPTVRLRRHEDLTGLLACNPLTAKHVEN